MRLRKIFKPTDKLIKIKIDFNQIVKINKIKNVRSIDAEKT